MGASAAIRPMREDDLPALAQIIADTWYDEDGEAAYVLGMDLLLMHVSLSTWGVVAEEGGEVLGCCFARVGGEELGAFADWRDAADANAEAAERLGVELAGNCDIDAEEHGLLDAVDAERGTVGVGYLQLLILSKAARGRGLGRALMDAGCEHLREAGCTRYRLTTDEACDVSLYDHLGLERLAEGKARCMLPRDFSLYVYEGAL